MKAYAAICGVMGKSRWSEEGFFRYGSWRLLEEMRGGWMDMGCEEEGKEEQEGCVEEEIKFLAL